MDDNLEPSNQKPRKGNKSTKNATSLEKLLKRHKQGTRDKEKRKEERKRKRRENDTDARESVQNESKDDEPPANDTIEIEANGPTIEAAPDSGRLDKGKGVERTQAGTPMDLDENEDRDEDDEGIVSEANSNTVKQSNARDPGWKSVVYANEEVSKRLLRYTVNETYRQEIIQDMMFYACYNPNSPTWPEKLATPKGAFSNHKKKNIRELPHELRCKGCVSKGMRCIVGTERYFQHVSGNYAGRLPPYTKCVGCTRSGKTTYCEYEYQREPQLQLQPQPQPQANEPQAKKPKAKGNAKSKKDRVKSLVESTKVSAPDCRTSAPPLGTPTLYPQGVSATSAAQASSSTTTNDGQPPVKVAAKVANATGPAVIPSPTTITPVLSTASGTSMQQNPPPTATSRLIYDAIGELHVMIGERFEELGERIEELEDRLDGLDEKLEGMGSAVEQSVKKTSKLRQDVVDRVPDKLDIESFTSTHADILATLKSNLRLLQQKDLPTAGTITNLSTICDSALRSITELKSSVIEFGESLFEVADDVSELKAVFKKVSGESDSDTDSEQSRSGKGEGDDSEDKEETRRVAGIVSVPPKLDPKKLKRSSMSSSSSSEGESGKGRISEVEKEGMQVEEG